MPPTYQDQNVRREPLPPDTLIAFIDETGDEGLSDDQYPLFGIGGCCCLHQDYDRLLREPWQRAIATIWPQRRTAPHAADARLSSGQARALSNFFAAAQFARFACTLHRESHFDGAEEMSSFDAVVSVAIDAIWTVADDLRARDFVLLFEASARGDALSKALLRRTAIDGRAIDAGFIPKSANEAGLQIADFVVRAAGRSVRDRSYGSVGDVAASIFDRVPGGPIHHFRALESFELRRNPEGTTPEILVSQRVEVSAEPKRRPPDQDRKK
jgi:hypothetical protein